RLGLDGEGARGRSTGDRYTLRDAHRRIRAGERDGGPVRRGRAAQHERPEAILAAEEEAGTQRDGSDRRGWGRGRGRRAARTVAKIQRPVDRTASVGLDGDADPDLVKGLGEDIAAVSGAIHPGRRHVLRRRKTVGDILRGGEEVVAFASHAVPWSGAVLAGMAEELPVGHRLGVLLRRAIQFRRAHERIETGMDALLIDTLE